MATSRILQKARALTAKRGRSGPRITDPDFVSRIAEVEGEEWLDMGSWRTLLDVLINWCATGGGADFSFGPTIINGSGGLSRYRVEDDGEIVFVGPYNDSRRARAEKAGFSVVE